VMIEKQCTKCKESKSLELFPKSSKSRDKKAWVCKACAKEYHRLRYVNNKELINERNKAWARNNPEKMAACRNSWNSRNLDRIKRNCKRWQSERSRPTKQGITNEQHQDLLNYTERKCFICGYLDEGDSNRWALDHDYKCHPKKGYSCVKCIRGVLCKNCNTGLGHFKDHVENLEKAIEYLKEPPAKNMSWSKYGEFQNE